MTLTASLATYTRLYLAHSLGPSSSIPGNLLPGSQPDCGPAAEGAIGGSLGCGESEKKRYCYHSRHVLTCPRNTTESGRRKLNKNKALTSKEQELIHMERISSPLGEFVKVLCTTWVPIPSRAAPTKGASVWCGGKRFQIPKTTTNVCLGVLVTFLDFYMILLSSWDFEGIT